MAELEDVAMEWNIDYVRTVILSGHLLDLTQLFVLGDTNKFLPWYCKNCMIKGFV